ncbi:MAG: sigma-54 dependent transcriptional regulator [Nitrospirota bacterium]
MPEIIKILIADDEEPMRFFLSEMLKKEGYLYETAIDGEDALEKIKRDNFDIAILDLKMPKLSGMELLSEIKKVSPDTVAIIITAHGTRNIAMEAIEKGAYDYFIKPFDVNEMRIVIKRAVEKIGLQKEIKNLKESLSEKYGLGNIIGDSPPMQQVYDLVKKIADTDITVLITGESGTGKELIAQTLHYMSNRRDKPFVKVNCAAIPETLLEEELFGHEKGAFTGAHQQKPGKFEIANNGTMFLDEIGDMTLSTQTKILRVIQEREFERIGGVKPIKVDVRLIAATNMDLIKLISEGRFREELYYRLNVMPIHLPPLRERQGDIPLLAEHFIKKYNKRFNKNIKGIMPEANDILLKYNWPGNIRELENLIQRGVVLAKDEIGAEINPPNPPLLKGGEGGLVRQGFSLADEPLTMLKKAEKSKEEIEKEMILEALKMEKWRREETAKRLEISRKSLHNKMKKYGLMT